jgi:DNA-binding response OmpR family regulator
MVSAKGDEEDVVHGLEVGADDYVPKPFRPKILLARVKAVLRRTHGDASEDEGEQDRITVKGVTLDRARHELKVDGEDINLTATEFRLLFYLASHPGRVFTRNQLIDSAIGSNALVIDRNIDVHVGSLRKKLGPYRAMIETVRGVGYRFKDA